MRLTERPIPKDQQQAELLHKAHQEAVTQHIIATTHTLHHPLQPTAVRRTTADHLVEDLIPEADHHRAAALVHAVQVVAEDVIKS
jgi:hypothetical protein